MASLGDVACAVTISHMDDSILTRVAQNPQQAEDVATLHMAGTCAQAQYLRKLVADARAQRSPADSVDVRWNLVFHDGKEPHKVSLDRSGSRAVIDGHEWQLAGKQIVAYLKSISLHLVPPGNRATTFSS